ncbi:MAG: endoglucanase [Muribaculaceae bacterium]|nr:endoglucanase [Muribaculaceae bacterium]MDE6832524.1 endoglucanase [Muribaculaceae bacterium]
MKKITLFIAGCAVALNINASKPQKSVSPSDPSLRYTGRVEQLADGSTQFDWAGVYLETRLNGSDLDIRLSDTGKSYYNVFVDGDLHKVVQSIGNDTIINFVSGLKGSKPHSLRIQKRTEGETGRTTLHELLIPAKASLAEEPRTRTRLIEIIGNSLTAGFGTEGKDRSEPWSVETLNCDLSYSTILPRYFDADYSLIAHSGRGVARNYGDSVRTSAVTMKHKFLQTYDMDTLSRWDFNRYTPDLVIINLGSNDFSTEPHPYRSEFVGAYKELIGEIREAYGQKPILCVFPPTMNAVAYPYMEEIVRDLADPDVHLVRLPDLMMNNTTDLGSVWHPNYNGQRKMAMCLIPVVSTITGWEISSKPIK